MAKDVLMNMQGKDMLKNNILALLFHVAIACIIVLPFSYELLPSVYRMLSLDDPFENLLVFAIILIVYILMGSCLKDTGSRNENMLSVLLITGTGLALYIIRCFDILSDLFYFFIAPFIYPVIIISPNIWQDFFGPEFIEVYYVGCCFYPAILLWLGITIKSLVRNKGTKQAKA